MTQTVPAAPQENRLSVLIGTPQIKTRFQEVLGQKAPAFVSSILSACNSNPRLRDADPMSIIASAMIAATLDLPINSNLGFAHIVPYDGKAQFQMGYKGFIQLAIRSGQYRTMNCAVVYDGEVIENDRITGNLVIDITKKKPQAKAVGYVGYFKLVGGFEKYLYMTIEEITEHGKKYSASFKTGKGLWIDDFDAMALKTVIKMLLSKWGILSVDMQKAIEVDQAVIEDLDGTPQYKDNQPPPQKIENTGGPDRLKSLMNKDEVPI